MPKHFDPRDFFPHLNGQLPDNLQAFKSAEFEAMSENLKAANPAYWMQLGYLTANKDKPMPWVWYGMMLGTMEAMRQSAKETKKIKRRHREAVVAMRKFTKHVAGAKAVVPPKKKKKKNNKNPDAGRPQGLMDPKGGIADDLKLISGIGPKLEELLNELGVYHFEQIAGWGRKQVKWVDDYLMFSGRIERDNWINQAAALARGGRDEYVRVFGKEPV